MHDLRIEDFFNSFLIKLLRFAVAPECEPLFLLNNLHEIDRSEWNAIREECVRHLLLGVAYYAICRLPKNQMPPLDIAFQWASEAETIKGQNKQLNQETVRLTHLFAAQGVKTAVLKGPANARLYPDPYIRQVGDIDLWVEGGRKKVIALLRKMGFKICNDDLISDHHVHLNDCGIDIEIHYKPCSGNNNLFTNMRLQRYLEKEILNAELVSEGFYVPSIKFALLMQLAHVQKHFFENGIGFKQLMDYCFLLQRSSQDDRQEVASKLKLFGLYKSCGAVMWILNEVFGLEKAKLLVDVDKNRGKILLNEILKNGNFGLNPEDKAAQSNSCVWSWLKRRWRSIRLLSFDPIEVLWHEIMYCRTFIRYMPLRIKLRRLSVRKVK